MKEIIKGYHVFLPNTWERWLLYLGYPVLIGLIIRGLELLGAPQDMCIMFCSSMIVTVELYFDFLVFGGIASKDTNKLEYLKTSARGMDVLQKSLIGDGIRRGISVVAIFALTGFIIDSTEYSILKFVMFIVGTLFLTELGLIVVRSFTVMGIVIFCIVLLGICALVLMEGILAAYLVVGGVCLFMYLLSLIAGRLLIMRRARRSYYDGRD